MKQVPILGVLQVETFDIALAAGQIDTGCYFRLLDQAGTQRAELVARLIADLEKVDCGLRQALANFDRAALRLHSHVLISLAGTFGAIALHRTAQTLNQSAHHIDTATNGNLGTIGHMALAQLGNLIDFVAQTIDAP
ncbi:MAG: hypothetical protein WCC57_18395 [Paracoccaceae bacterium]